MVWRATTTSCGYRPTSAYGDDAASVGADDDLAVDATPVVLAGRGDGLVMHGMCHCDESTLRESRAAQRPRDQRPTLARLPEKKDTDLRLNAVDIDGDNSRSRWSDAWQRTPSLGSYNERTRRSVG